ncbi:MAG: hypothetical protein KGI06_04815 [Candidatus Micrarchaeota archaeon]|nr:hypothetical protein [Candidatus Micrarchaeota archaeon]
MYTPIQSTNYAGYYGLIMIPIGMAVYFIIRYGSDLSTSYNGLCINSGEYFIDKEYISVDELYSTINARLKENDRVFIVKNLPLRINELSFKHLNVYASSKSAVLDNMNDYLQNLIECNLDEMMCKNNVIIRKEDNFCKKFSARIAYDEFINHGSFSIKDKLDKFLYKNEISAENDLSLKVISKSNMIKTVFTFSYTHRRAFASRFNLFGYGNGLIFFMMLNDLVRVINC